MKTNIFLSFLLSAVVAVSCTNLDEELYSTVPDGSFGTTPAEVQALVGGAYSSLRGFSDEITTSFPTTEVFFINEVSSDEATIPTRGVNWYDGGRYQEMQRHDWTPQNPLVFSVWRYAYNGIAKVNSIIYQIDKSALTTKEKEPIYAELKAVRSYYYLVLLDLFGNVPIVTDFADLTLPTNSSRTEVFNFVEKELTEAIPHLKSGVVYSKFTKNVAYALLSRLYLNAEVYTGKPRWADALKMAQNVSGYSLNGDYFGNFLVENQNSPEIILSIPFDSKAGTVGNYIGSMSFHYLHRFTIAANGDYPWCANGISAQPGVYSAFKEDDKRRKSLAIGDQISLATGSTIVMDNGEPLTYTENITSLASAKENEGARINKYEQKPGEKYERDHDWVLVRYAEMLMIQAECHVRMGNPSLAKPLVDQVLARTGTKAPDNITLDYLNEELMKEFIFEGQRRTTNIRFGTFFKPWWEKGATAQYRNIFPIPSTVLITNTNLKQNPGY